MREKSVGVRLVESLSVFYIGIEGIALGEPGSGDDFMIACGNRKLGFFSDLKSSEMSQHDVLLDLISTRCTRHLVYTWVSIADCRFEIWKRRRWMTIINCRRMVSSDGFQNQLFCLFFPYRMLKNTREIEYTTKVPTREMTILHEKKSY